MSHIVGCGSVLGCRLMSGAWSEQHYRSSKIRLQFLRLDWITVSVWGWNLCLLHWTIGPFWLLLTVEDFKMTFFLSCSFQTIQVQDTTSNNSLRSNNHSEFKLRVPLFCANTTIASPLDYLLIIIVFGVCDGLVDSMLDCLRFHVYIYICFQYIWKSLFLCSGSTYMINLWLKQDW